MWSKVFTKEKFLTLIKAIQIQTKLKWIACTFTYIICLARDITISPTILAYMSIELWFLFSNLSMWYCVVKINGVNRIYLNLVIKILCVSNIQPWCEAIYWWADLRYPVLQFLLLWGFVVIWRSTCWHVWCLEVFHLPIYSCHLARLCRPYTV